MNISPVHSCRVIKNVLKKPRNYHELHILLQHKPIYQASAAQNNEEDKGYYIDSPQF